MVVRREVDTVGEGCVAGLDTLSGRRCFDDLLDGHAVDGHVGVVSEVLEVPQRRHLVVALFVAELLAGVRRLTGAAGLNERRPRVASLTQFVAQFERPLAGRRGRHLPRRQATTGPTEGPTVGRVELTDDSAVGGPKASTGDRLRNVGMDRECGRLGRDVRRCHPRAAGRYGRLTRRRDAHFLCVRRVGGMRQVLGTCCQFIRLDVGDVAVALETTLDIAGGELDGAANRRPVAVGLHPDANRVEDVPTDGVRVRHLHGQTRDAESA